jgi:hypothetical protein
MFLLVFAVPALLVVALGYSVGHAVWSRLGGLLDPSLDTARHAEVAGWLAGLFLLVASTWVALRAWRRRPRGR